MDDACTVHGRCITVASTAHAMCMHLWCIELATLHFACSLVAAWLQLGCSLVAAWLQLSCSLVAACVHPFWTHCDASWYMRACTHVMRACTYVRDTRTKPWSTIMLHDQTWMVQCNVIESTLNSGIDIPGHRSTDGRPSVKSNWALSRHREYL